MTDEPIDVDAYDAAGAARVAEDECDGTCACSNGYCNDPEDPYCDDCFLCCTCTSCEYARVA